jgi:hypothetical protein
MSAETEPGTDVPGPDVARRRRRLLLAILAAAVVAAIVVVVLVVRSGDDLDPAARSGASSTATSSAAASASPTASAFSPAPGPTDANEPPPALPPVALDARSEVGNGVVATLPSIDQIQGTAQGPGNIAGPAIRVTVRIENGTAAPVSLEGVAVNMYFGAELTPASPLEDPSRKDFFGTVAPGKSAEGVYVFSVPSDARDSVTVEVGYAAGAPLLMFTGAV